MIFQPPDTTKSMKIIEKPLFFQWFCESHIFLLFPLVAAIWITFSLKNGCKSFQIRVLAGVLAPFWRSFLLPWDDICALQLSTSLVWLPLGAKLCSQSPPRPFLKRFLVPKSWNFLQFWFKDHEISTWFQSFHAFQFSNPASLQSSNHPSWDGGMRGAFE